MKKTLILIIGLVVAGISATCAQSNEGTITLKVRVEGIIKGKGNLEISVFDSENTWLESPIKKRVIDLAEVEHNEFEITGIAKGNYGISVVQDENKNGEIDMGFMGPEEGYGFSNNPNSMFGPAPFKKAVMAIQEDKSITIRLN
ncbi:MAG: DUF2141 domain-containing protein [Fulvivirga sp.]|nr:DUF2141 domain-containing protein [Fulvivirga sp.]